MKKILVGAAALLSAQLAMASALDVSLSDETAQFGYFTDVSRISTGGVDVGVMGWYDEYENVIGAVNIKATSNRLGNNRAIQLGFGGKLYGIDFDNKNIEDVAGLGLGLLVRFVIPSSTPMGFAVEGYVSPKVTTSDEADNISEFNARFEVEVMPAAMGYIGYRSISVNYPGDNEISLDENLHFGMRISF